MSGLRIAVRWVALFALFWVEPALAQPEPTWLGGQVYQENDSFVAGDERYTQGLRLQLVKSKTPRFVESIGEQLTGRLWSSKRSVQPSFSVFFGQAMYTPEIITAPFAYPGDQGFVGVAYGGVQLHFTETGQRFRHTFETYVGWRGEASMAGAAQKGLHVLRFRRIPKGWDLQDPSDFVLNFNYRFERRVMRCLRFGICGDVTGGALASVGNMRTGAGVSGVARVGYRLTGFPLAAIPEALALPGRSKVEGGLVWGYEGRGVADNGLLRASGTSGPHFQAKPYVRDNSRGAYVRVKDVRLSLLEVRRSAEFEYAGQPGRNQRFRSIALSYEPPAPSNWGPPKYLRHIRAELGLGNSPLGPRLSSGTREPGPAARAGFSWGPVRPWFVGFEIGGTVVENQPPTADASVHNDTFLTYRALTLGVRPAWARDRLSVRAGPTLFGQSAKVETIQNPIPDGGVRPREDREARYFHGGAWGWIGSVQYMFAPQKHVALGLGATYGGLKLREPVTGIKRTDFIAVTLGVELRLTPPKDADRDSSVK